MNLKGNDALNKANKLMESMATKPKVDSFSNVESRHLAYDGKYYGIVRENSMYVLKVANKKNPLISEDFDYINGVQNKSRYSNRAYNEVMKQFNLINIELKRVNGEGLLREALEEEKKVLKVKKKSTDQNLSATELDAPPEDNALEEPVDDLGSEEDFDMGDEETEETSENPDDYKDVDPDDLDTDDPVKKIQKLSGKLAYELRELEDDDYSDTAKFALSMAISAVDSTKMSDEDMNDLEHKMDNQFDVQPSDEVSTDDMGEEPVEETLSALDNIHTKVGSFAIDEPMMECVDDDKMVLFDTNEQDRSDVEDEMILFDESWDSSEPREIDPNKEKIDIGVYRYAEDLVYDYDYFNKVFLRDEHYQNREPKNTYVEYHSDRTHETPFILHVNGKPEKFQYVNAIYPLNNVDENAYSEAPKPPKNKKFATSIGDLEVGRYYGDDDAVMGEVDEAGNESPEDFEFGKVFYSSEKPRNPFKYR